MGNAVGNAVDVHLSDAGEQEIRGGGLAGSALTSEHRTSRRAIASSVSALALSRSQKLSRLYAIRR